MIGEDSCLPSPGAGHKDQRGHLETTQTCTEDPWYHAADDDTAHFVVLLDILHSLEHLKVCLEGSSLDVYG